MGLGSILHIDGFSLVHKGQRVQLETTVQQMTDPDRQEVVCHAVPRLAGGGPSKQQQKLLAKNAIAAVLLEHGLELGWVKQTVETLHDECGIPKLQQILVGSTSAQKLKDIKHACLDLGIHFPSVSAPNESGQCARCPEKQETQRKHIDYCTC